MIGKALSRSKEVGGCLKSIGEENTLGSSVRREVGKKGRDAPQTDWAKMAQLRFSDSLSGAVIAGDDPIFLKERFGSGIAHQGMRPNFFHRGLPASDLDVEGNDEIRAGIIDVIPLKPLAKDQVDRIRPAPVSQTVQCTAMMVCGERRLNFLHRVNLSGVRHFQSELLKLSLRRLFEKQERALLGAVEHQERDPGAFGIPAADEGHFRNGNRGFDPPETFAGFHFVEIEMVVGILNLADGPNRNLAIRGLG